MVLFFHLVLTKVKFFLLFPKNKNFFLQKYKFNYVKMWCSTKNIFSFKSDILQNIAASNVKKGKYIFFLSARMLHAEYV